MMAIWLVAGAAPDAMIGRYRVPSRRRGPWGESEHSGQEIRL